MTFTVTPNSNYIVVPKGSKLIIKEALKNQNIPVEFMPVWEAPDEVPTTCVYKGQTIGCDHVYVLHAPVLSEEIFSFLENQFRL